METIKMTPQELMKRLRERAEKAKAEGKTIKSMPMPMKHEEIIAKLRERAMLKKADLKKVEVAEIEKKEE